MWRRDDDGGTRVAVAAAVKLWQPWRGGCSGEVERVVTRGVDGGDESAVVMRWWCGNDDDNGGEMRVAAW
ncbi:hypothetical protein Tco_0428618 [Tanacetum coccineum]